MAATVVADTTTNRVRYRIDIAKQRFNRFASEVIVTFKSSVQLGDVSRMVLPMVDFHRTGVNVGFESGVRVRKIRKRMSHSLQSVRFSG